MGGGVIGLTLITLELSYYLCVSLSLSLSETIRFQQRRVAEVAAGEAVHQTMLAALIHRFMLSKYIC